MQPRPRPWNCPSLHRSRFTLITAQRRPLGNPITPRFPAGFRLWNRGAGAPGRGTGSGAARVPSTVLTDRQWDNARRCVLGERGKPGRNAQNNRRKLEGMLWTFRVGAPWRAHPAEFGDWSNVCHTFRRWAAWGVFLLMFLALASARNITSAW